MNRLFLSAGFFVFVFADVEINKPTDQPNKLWDPSANLAAQVMRRTW